MKTGTRIRSVVALAAALMMVFAGVATADELVNDVLDLETNVKSATITSGGSVVVKYRIAGTGQSGCDTDPGPSVTVDAPAGVNASPSSFSFTQSECRDGDEKSVTFSSSAPGSHSIGHTLSYTLKGGPDRSMVNKGDFALNVRPRAASSLGATAGVEKVDLSWSGSPDGPAGIDGYRVYQDGVAIATQTGLTREVTGLTAGREYCFTVKAYKGGLESDASNQACATPEAPVLTPPAPSYSGTFLSPVDGNGTINIVKQGRTVPVKLEIYADDEEIKTGSVTFTQRKGSCSSAAESDLVSEFASTNNTGSSFRFVTEGSQDFWQFNLNTKNVSLGCNNFDIWHGDTLVATFVLNVTK